MHLKVIMHFVSLWIDFTVSQIANSYHQVAKEKKANMVARWLDQCQSRLTYSFFSLILFNTFVHFLWSSLFKNIYINIQGVPKKCIHTLSDYNSLQQTFFRMPRIREQFGDEEFYFQQDGAPPHYHRDMRA